MAKRIDEGGTTARAKSRKKPANRLADARARMYHDLIFEAAECVFGRKGYDGATMQEIAEEAGTSLKTVYATYESKQDLYAQISRERGTAFYELVGEALSGDDDPRDRLARAVEAYTRFLFEHEDWLRIHLHGRVAWAFRPTSDDEVARRWEAGRDRMSKLLREGMEQCVFHDGDPDETALLVQTVMQVVVGRSLQRGERDPHAVAEAILVQLRRLLEVTDGAGVDAPPARVAAGPLRAST